MKKRLQDKLAEQDRKLAYFWRNHVKGIVTYQHFARMLNDDSPMREDVAEIIKSYLEE